MNKYQEYTLTNLLWKAAVDRDRCVCQIGKHQKKYMCFGRKIELAHIFPKGKYKKLKWDLRNVLLICDECHRWWHSKNTKAKIWFEEKFPSRWIYLRKRVILIEHIVYNDDFFNQTRKELTQ